MKFPLFITIGDWNLNAHAILEGLAHLVGVAFFWSLRRRNPDPFSKLQRWWLICSAALGAVLGSKGVSFLESLGQGLPAPNLILLISGKTIVGGLLGGWAGVEIAKKLMGTKTSSGDLFVFPLIAGILIGRLGCFSAGVFDGTHGLPSSLPWALDMGDGITRHPTQLYEMLFLLIGSVLLWRLRTSLLPGGLFRLFMAGYLLYRFLSETIKPVPELFLGLSGIQWACVVGLALHWNLLSYWNPSPKPEPAHAR